MELVGHVAEAELLKLQKSGQFPDKLCKIGGAHLQISRSINCFFCFSSVIVLGLNFGYRGVSRCSV